MRIETFSILGVIFLGIILSVCASSSTLNSKAKPVLAAEEHVSAGGMAYIDTHNHLVGRLGPRTRFTDLDYDGAARIALATMDKLGIKKMFIMPPPFSRDHPHKYDVDDFIGTVKKYSDRFAFLGGGGTLNVMIQQAVHDGNTSKEVRNRFEKKALEILSKGALGFGEMTAEHLSLGPNHPYESAPPDHPLFLLLADIAARHDVPIDIHMEAIPEEMPLPKWLRSPPNPGILRPNITAFERLLTHNRKAKIIWAHVGWDNTGSRTAALTAEMLKKHPNLYMSFKISPRDSLPESRPIERGRGLKEEWLKVIRNFLNALSSVAISFTYRRENLYLE